MTEQEIENRLQYIFNLNDSMIRGDRPAEWVSFAIKEPEKESEIYPTYIKVKCDGYEHGTFRFVHDKFGKAHYTNGTHVGRYMTSDMILHDNFLKREYTYETVSRKEHLEYNLRIAESYVTTYDMENHNVRKLD